MSQSSTNRNVSFDPCSVFPSRIAKRKFKAQPIVEGGSGAGGSTDLVKGNAFIPLANTAYARTIRLHEALHAVYTPKPSKERIKSGKGFSMLEQALEDARLHLNCAKTSSSVRRDELATALLDLHSSTSKYSGISSDLAALIALRGAAILSSQDYTGKRSGSAFERLNKLCEKVAPEYHAKMLEALGLIGENKMAEAEALLKPYFPDKPEQPTSEVFPSAIKGEEKAEAKAGDSFADVSFDRIEGKLSSDAADMLGKGTIAAVKAGEMPKLHVIPMFASSMIPTFFGETQKHVMGGCKIHAKKLACIVGPVAPKVFLKTIRRNGGTVLIDASGSMTLCADVLLELVNKAPAATIAFYNAPTDLNMCGNLWIYCHKGKRAGDFSSIDFKPMQERKLSEKYVGNGRNVYGWGNVVDFQALMWLLAQDGPRYVLTDGKFTGPEVSQHAASELLGNAIARKKITQVTSLKKMNEILAIMRF